MFSSNASRLAQPALLPDFDRPSGLPAFNTVEQVIATYQGDDAIHLLYPQVIAAAAETFLTGFPGQVVYAVKANPHPAVLKILWASGIRNFDVASIREIDLVQSIAKDAQLFLMHPVKSRQTIRHAYRVGVRDMAFDCEAELTKILTETDHAGNLKLHLRLAISSGAAAMPLEGKFGATRRQAIALLRLARPHTAHLGLSFHVGSQCMDTADYERTIAYVRDLLNEADITIDSLDCGGGFPVAYPGMTPPPMADYFETIQTALTANGFKDITIYGEPGRALCAQGGSTLARVELRKGKALYLNDGSYGSLFDAAQCSWKYPTKLHTAEERSDTLEEFRFFGPTCDSLDMMEGPFALPADIQEGDWIEICHLGAYGQALATDFNGFQSDATVAILG